MDINACIFNKEGNIQGCITNSVLDRFQQEFDDLFKKYHDTNYSVILETMNKMLIKSQRDKTAQFLNFLKLIVRKYNDCFSLQFLQDVSRVYHNLVRYTCSTVVYQEVFDKTIAILRDNNIDYKGKDVQGVEENECAFEYDGFIIGIKIRDKYDLYNLWNQGNETTAVVYAGSEKYVIIECEFDRIILAIKACIEDYKYYQQDDYTDIVQELLNIADKIFNNKDC